MRILIVEDEKALAEILEYNFKKEGYVVDTASDGEIALDKITPPTVSNTPSHKPFPKTLGSTSKSFLSKIFFAPSFFKCSD